MARITNPDIAIMDIPRQQAQDESRQLREAENVLSSYSHVFDFVAEALQNAVDAIDERTAVEPGAPARILITFDAKAATFTVADTGIGMRRSDVRMVLAPNVTTKSGHYARGGRRSRGEKGVGLTFLALGSNFLQIRTCDGSERQEVTVEGASSWVRSLGKAKAPVGKHYSDTADTMLGSTRYTAVTVGGIDAQEFDKDLFSYAVDELVWNLRTKTAVGNTRYLFERPFSPLSHADEIEVTLRFISRSGRRSVQKVPYAYATPEELAPGRPVIDLAEVRDLPADKQVRKLRGVGVRYVKRTRMANGRLVSIYAYVTNGDEMRALLSDRPWAVNWQGFFLATREMPTGVQLGQKVIPTQAYERRVFALIVDDDLILDMGRKTLHGQTRMLLGRALALAWQKDLSKVVPRVAPQVAIRDVDRAALSAAIKRAVNEKDLNAPVPYLKVPTSRAGVVALYHELVAANLKPLPRLRTLQSGTFSDDDELIYSGDPNGVPPLHALFGLQATEVIKDIEGAGGLARTAQLAIVWELGPRGLDSMGVEVVETDSGEDGATHVLLLRGVAGMDELRVLALETVLRDRL